MLPLGGAPPGRHGGEGVVVVPAGDRVLLARRPRTTSFFSPTTSTLNILDEMKRIPGTTDVQIFGAKDYAMRIWLRPDRLRS